MNRSASKYRRAILVVALLAYVACSTSHAQSLPQACYRLMEDSLSKYLSPNRLIGTDIAYESMIAQALTTGDEPWYAGTPRLDRAAIIDSLHRVDPDRTEGVLAWIMVDQARYGSVMAMHAAISFRRIGGRPSVLLPVLLRALSANRVLIGLGALGPALSDAESQSVLMLACQASWPLEAFKADARFGSLYERGEMNDDWPAQNDYILVEAARLLTGGRREVVVELLRRSGTAARIPEAESPVR
jgi:hypothetical protein